MTTENKLKLNDAKTEVLVIVPSYHANQYPDMQIDNADATVHITKTTKTLGTLFNRRMNMKQDI